MVKMNFTNSQTSFEYALYMIAASYFNKSACLSEITEKNMLLQYKEQKLNSQYQMEEICIEFMDNLVSKIPSRFFERSVAVKLNKTASGKTEIVIGDKQSFIVFHAPYAGKKSQIRYQIWCKKPLKIKWEERLHRAASLTENKIIEVQN